MTQPIVPGRDLSRRALRAAGRLALTGAVVAAAGGAVLGGRTILADRAAAAPAAEASAAVPVEVARIEMRDHFTATRRFSGQLEARQRTDLSFEQPGTIADVLVREGEAVAPGQVVARLDTRLLEAERARLEAARAGLGAQAELARRTGDRQVELRDRGFAAEQAVDDTSLRLAQLQAEIAGIDAALSAVDVNLSKAELVAPFAGVIATRSLDAGSVASPGVPVASLTEDAPPRFHAGLDPETAAGLAQGERAVILTGGRSIPVRLAGLSPTLDPATRSRMAFFELEGDELPPDGSTGEVTLTRAHRGRGRVGAAGGAAPRAARDLDVADGTGRHGRAGGGGGSASGGGSRLRPGHVRG